MNPESSWTIEALKEHLEAQLVAVRAAMEQRARTDDDARVQIRVALDKFEATVAARFIQVNEFRAALDDLGKTMATRRELESALLSMEQHFEENRRNITDLRSRIDVGPKELHSLQTRADFSQGRAEGVNRATAMALTLVAFFTPLVTGLVIWAITHP